MYKSFNYKEREYIFLESTDSTNNDMKKAVRSKKEPVFSVIAAGKQSSGRGRLGRQFFSPDGGIYFSLSLPLNGNEINISFITLLAGLAVSEAIEEITGVETQIKWPNDIYLNGKKLGGILCELVSGACITAVVGAGINLDIKEEEIPEELSDKMTSFYVERKALPDKKQLIEAVVKKTDNYIYERKELFGVTEDTLSKIRSRSFSVGKRVRYILEDTVCEGIVTDITNTGAAVILLDDGTKKDIFCGEIIQ